MENKINIEVCIDSVESAIIAQNAGAHRVELCDNLLEGGTTPSSATIEFVRKAIKIDLNVIIRPRGGDFLYSKTELEIIKKDIHNAKMLGADGLVFGVLTSDGNIDVAACKSLIEMARPMSVTFHRAFDVCKNPFQALEILIDLGFDRLLTSGQKNKAEEGIELIAELVKLADNKIIIMPGSGINELNFSSLMEKSKAKEFHVSCRSEVESKMEYRKEDVKMGAALNYNEFVRKVSDLDKLKLIISKINN